MFIKICIALCVNILVIAAAENKFVPRNQGIKESKCESCRDVMGVLYSILDKVEPFLEIVVKIVDNVCPAVFPWIVCSMSNSFLNNYVRELKDHSSANIFCQEHNCEVYVLFRKESLIEINL